MPIGIDRLGRGWAKGLLFAAAGLTLCAAAAQALVGSTGLMPHGVCYTWNRPLMGLHVTSDVLIGLAYFSIPFALVYFARKRSDLPFPWIFWLFGLFIVACGATHWMEVWTLWYPHYWLSGAVKGVTALASLPTAIVLALLIPHALELPSVRQLREAKEALEREIAQRQAAEDGLRQSYQLLEARVAERTAELQAANQALRESRELFQGFMDNTPARAWVKDEEGRYVFRNRASEQVIGRDASQYIGRTDFDLFPHDEAAQLRANDQQVLDSAAAQRFIETLMLDGHERKTLAVKFPIRIGGRRYLGGVAMDITEQLAVQEVLHENDRRKNEFLAILAHELRNPLSPIRSAAELVRVHARDHAELRRASEVIERQIRQMARLLDDLMDVSRITRNRLELRPERVDIAGIVAAALEQSMSPIEANRHRLDVRVPEQPVYVYADPTRIAQVLCNLLTNAAKYTDPGGVIEVSCEATVRELRLAVRDNGIGIAASQLPRLFEMFSQGVPALERSGGGLGIGLALVRGLVEMHGGRVEAHSDGPGRGSEFVVWLPLADRASLPVQAAGPQRSDSAGSTPRRLRILVADDNRDAADTLATLLELQGHDVKAAYDGPSALHAVQDLRPELAVLDIGLPGMNGYELARSIRSTPWGTSATLLALTGWGQDEDKQRALEAGFDRHFTKPLEPAQLIAILAELSLSRSSG